MGSNWTYAVAALLAALVAVFERFGSAPIPAVQGSSVPAAGLPAMTAAARTLALTHVAARKADDRFRPRGRRR